MSVPHLSQTATAVETLLGRIGGRADVAAAAPTLELDPIGWHGTVPIALTSQDARQLGGLARTLARRGDLKLLVGLQDGASHYLFAVTITPVRIACVEQSSPLLRRLIDLAAAPRATPLEHAIALSDAIDIDAAGRATFRLLHRLLDQGIEALPPTVPRADRHAWVLVQVTRLLFLRFVEAEGWLNNDPHFLARQFDHCLVARRDPARHLLHPLFFGTLNRPTALRSRLARSFGGIPFLNGGLFEPHAVERRYRFRIPLPYWQDLFAALVDRVEVSLDPESADGRVTPEMLGRVFEGVMHPEERKAAGAFFTPPELVRALVRAAVTSHLSLRLSCSEQAVDAQLDHPDERLRRELLNLTICDPAAGSGAFLVGALDLLHGPGPRDAARVRHLITRRLFGIDRHPGAVRICELRLWLELLRSMRGRAATAIPPLPNLDANIRAGDALIDPLYGSAVDGVAVQRLRVRQRTLAAAHGCQRRVALSQVRRDERIAVLRALKDREASVDGRIADLVSAARSPDLFGKRTPLDGAARMQLDAQRRLRRQLRVERRRYLRDATATPFALHAAFAPVMSRRGGFDLVVGNPPWVRAEDLPPSTRDALGARYRWWRGSGRGGWQHLPDLSIAFLERGFSLLAPGGTLGFLVPAKVATASYATRCRASLASQSTLHCVADLADDPRAGFDATTYPLALVASRLAPAATHHVRLGLICDAASQLQSHWYDAPVWMTAAPPLQRLAARLARQFPALAEHVRPQLGLKTGANEAFLDPPESLRRWSRPVLRGRDIRPFRAIAQHRMLWPADDRGTAWPTLPDDVAAYLAPSVSRLEARADQQRGPWWQLFRTDAATSRYRVVWRDVAPQLEAAVIHDRATVPINSCYVAAMGSTIAAEALAAWLNSTPARALARVAAEPAAGGCARFAARAVGSIPTPAAVVGHVELAALSRRAAKADVQQELDQCAATLLGLSAGELEALQHVAAHRR